MAARGRCAVMVDLNLLALMNLASWIEGVQEYIVEGAGHILGQEGVHIMLWASDL